MLNTSGTKQQSGGMDPWDNRPPLLVEFFLQNIFLFIIEK